MYKLKKFSLRKIIFIAIVIIAVIAITFTVVVPSISNSEKSKKEIVSVASLEKIINVSELSTCTAVYNGIAQVNNSENPEEIDYYVSYEATVKAGIDFDKVAIDISDATDSDNEKKKTVKITIPEIHITDINVDISSLDFIFLNNNSNQSTVTEEAYKACNEDVKNESENQQAIYDLAKQNSQSVIKALVEPILNQLNEEQQDIHYELVIAVEE